MVFADGSVGWYEAGWGPMMSETAHFVKDVVSPNGAVSIVSDDHPASDDVDGHTKVGSLRVHKPDGGGHLIDLAAEPGHQELCDAEQAYMLRAISKMISTSKAICRMPCKACAFASLPTRVFVQVA